MSDLLYFETPNWKVKLSENQYYLGRSFIIFKGDSIHLSQLSVENFIELKEIINKLETVIIKTFGATHFNWTCLMNDYYKPKNQNMRKELHLHLWPRYESIVEFQGEKFIDEVFGHHYDKMKEKLVSKDVLNEIKNALILNLS